MSTHHPGGALPVPRRRRRPLGRADLKFTGLTQNLGHLCGSLYSDFQSNCWANVRILGQPCDLHLAAALGLEVLAEPVGRRHRDRHRRARPPLAIGRDVILTARPRPAVVVRDHLCWTA